jgi:hypothetical protein
MNALVKHSHENIVDKERHDANHVPVIHIRYQTFQVREGTALILVNFGPQSFLKQLD